MLRPRFFLLLLSIAAVAPCPLSAQAPADDADLERINAAIVRAQQELAGYRSERGEIAVAIEASEKLILDNQREIDAIRDELAEQQRALDGLHAQQQELETAGAAQQALIASYARGAWISGNEEYLKLVLNQEDPARAARLLRYYRYFSEARADKLTSFNATLAALADVEANIAARNAVLAEQQQLLALQQDDLVASQQERHALLARLELDVAARGAEIDKLEMDKIEIELLLQELQSSLEDLTIDEEQEPFASRKGQLIWPLDGPHINSFGARHNLGDLTWEGVTIGATAGANIKAIHHGRVVFAGWFTSSGLLLIIDHGDGYMSLYAHNQELFKAVGDWVAAGDVVAAAGNTGGQREASLYFEIRRNGRAENPVNWCVPR